MEAARRDADQRFLEIDTHIENFLKFMAESTYDPHGLEQRLRDAMRQAATPDEAENRLRYLEREIANFLGFRQDSPCMPYVNSQIEMIRHTADTALARANRAETDIEKLQIRVIRDDVSDLQETLIELMERVSTVEQSSKEHGATAHTLSEKVAALNRAEARSIHDFNLTWEFLRPCLRVLFPSAPRIYPMFTTNTSPLVLHATLFSLRRLSDNSRHTPPSSTTSILHRIHLQGTTREAAEAAGPAVANVVAMPAGAKATQPAVRGAKQRSTAPSAEPAPVINVPVPDPAQRTFVDVVQNRTRTPMASNPSSPQRTTTAAAGSDASPTRSVLEQAAATALPDSSDSDRANDSGVPTPQVGSPARAGRPVSSAGATTATETVTGPQLVHRTNVPVVQLKASSSMSLGGPSPSTGMAPQEPTTSTREVKSPVTAEAPSPASPQADAGSPPPAPKVEQGEGSNSQAVHGETLPDLPKIRVTAPTSPAAGTPRTPTTPASRRAKRELAKLASDWPSFQADTSLERKARRRSPTPASPRSETEEPATLVGTLDIYANDPGYDEDAEMAALDELLAPLPTEVGASHVSGTDAPGTPKVCLGERDFTQAADSSLDESNSGGVPWGGGTPLRE
jgi:hypothetical protein